ncbi:MAG: type II secretion system F family protein [Rothia sp. (in: high G+C Gram-positive bacteria)]|nr:type II secretion system F family protein [Rothia sp. (in: high G+C Gram-positive bacteria)]
MFSRLPSCLLPQKTLDEPVFVSAAIYLDLFSAQLQAGLGLIACLENLALVDGGRFGPEFSCVAARLRAGASWDQAWQLGELAAELIPVRDAVGFMLDTGAPAANFLGILAQRQRRNEYRQAEKAAARLSVKLVLPLGLCSLPAFICLGVIPVLLGLIPGIMGS